MSSVLEQTFVETTHLYLDGRQEQLRPNLRAMPLSSKIIPVLLVIFLTSSVPVNAAFSKVLLTNDGTRTYRISVPVSTTLSDFLK
jgi:hypothetical protein